MTAAARLPLRFAMAGALNTLFGFSIYPLLLWGVPGMQQRYMLALGIAQLVATAFAFVTYKLGVFRSRGRIVREFGLFSGFYLFAAAANWAILPLLVELVGLPPIVAQLGFGAVQVVASYFWHSRVTFSTAGESV